MLNMSTYLTAAIAWSTSRSEYFSVLPLSGPWNGQEHVFTPHVHVHTDFLCDTGDRSPNTTSWLRPQVHRKFVTKMQKDCHYITVCGTHWKEDAPLIMSFTWFQSILYMYLMTLPIVNLVSEEAHSQLFKRERRPVYVNVAFIPRCPSSQCWHIDMMWSGKRDS